MYKIEVQVQAGSIGSLAASLLATVLFVTQVVVKDNWDFGLYAVIFSVSAAGFLYKAFRMKRRRDIALAIAFTLATLLLTALHILELLDYDVARLAG
ncbi:hypothetical protein IDH44_09390 [Paenibacillus sp. IB182496]|uniref:Uncharacterized protein n=1 Tax=Paenibacillus sabuli TaxID=2772509 RepID=A0A927GS70_9BACL|nr:hypothetical protein [Paenibacillus sabuli]